MAHLLDECGVVRPALVRGLIHQPDHAVREEVFRAELDRRGLRVEESFVLEGLSRPDLAFREVRRAIQNGLRFDAVVTMDDWSAVAAVQAILGQGLRVPQDVRVTGFDNYPISSASWPQLTTVDQQLDAQGRLAAQLLLQVEPVPDGPLHLVDCRLMSRGSTTAISVNDERDAAIRAIECRRSRNSPGAELA